MNNIKQYGRVIGVKTEQVINMVVMVIARVTVVNGE